MTILRDQLNSLKDFNNLSTTTNLSQTLNMQFKATIIALFATLAAAQDLSGLPTCSQPCFINAFPASGCTDPTDYACLCASSTFNNEVTLCALGACGAADQIATLTWARDTCAAAGVPL